MAVQLKAQQETVGYVSVRIVAPFQTCHEGTVYGSGASATVPAEVASAWVLNGWAESA